MANVERLSDGLADAALPPRGETRGDIDDEIGDHLALAARDLQLAGHTSEEARQLAVAKFGDIEQIRRKCWWIQQGDAVMARLALGLAIAVLILAVVGLAIGGWRMNSAINDLGDTLAAINESQKALVDSQKQVNRPLVIRGRLYIGEKSKPAEYAEVHLYRLPEAKLVEQISADNEGRFMTPPLEPGQYFLIAPLVGDVNPIITHAEPIGPVPLFMTQSKPISAYPWADIEAIELNVEMVPAGQISFELTEPLSAINLNIPSDAAQRARREERTGSFNPFSRDEVTLTPSLRVVIPHEAPPSLPIREVWQRPNKTWPLIGVYGSHLVDQREFVGARYGPYGPPKREIQPDETILFAPLTSGSSAALFKTGTYPVAAFVDWRFSHFQSPKDEKTADLLNALPAESIAMVEVRDNQRTHLKITPAMDNNAIHAAFVDALADRDTFLKVVYERRPANIEIVGQMELIE
jgi:hypothetical protein